MLMWLKRQRLQGNPVYHLHSLKFFTENEHISILHQLISKSSSMRSVQCRSFPPTQASTSKPPMLLGPVPPRHSLPLLHRQKPLSKRQTRGDGSFSTSALWNLMADFLHLLHPKMLAWFIKSCGNSFNKVVKI